MKFRMDEAHRMSCRAVMAECQTQEDRKRGGSIREMQGFHLHESEAADAVGLTLDEFRAKQTSGSIKLTEYYARGSLYLDSVEVSELAESLGRREQAEYLRPQRPRNRVSARSLLEASMSRRHRLSHIPSAKAAKAVSGVGEWAGSSVNLQTGCEHDCRYCYAKCQIVRTRPITANDWRQPVIRQKDVNKGYRKRSGRIMFPTSHDITPRNITECLTVLRKLLGSGNEVLIVSKPHLDCIQTLCRELDPYRRRITFRFSIGSVDDEVLSYWEPGAPSFPERVASLKFAHGAGFATSVSCEPMLDQNIGKVVDAVRPFVTDSIWLGRANNLMQALGINGRDDDEAKVRGRQLLSEQTDDYLRALYSRYRNDSLIRFKDSIKKAVGLKRPTQAGLDV